MTSKKKEKEQLVLTYLSNKKKDPRLQEKIITAYTPLVEYIARKLAFIRDDIPDLTQVGSIGLLKALKHFDPSKGIAFSTFASSNIIGEIRHYIRDKNSLLKLPRKLQEHYSKIRQFIKLTTQQTNNFPTVSEIAEKLELTEESVIEALEANHNFRVISLDKPVNTRQSKSTPDNFSLLDSLGVSAKVESVINKEIIDQALSNLPERGQQIIHLRYYDGLTQKEIADRMNLSQMHISRLLSTSIKQLRKILHHLKDHI